jgi:hypothetical protein
MNAAVITAGVHTTVNYIRNRPATSEPTLTFVSEDETLSTMQTLPGVPVTITDARQAAAEGAQFDLDTDGFGLFPLTRWLVDFDQIEEDPEVDQRYQDEIVARLQQITGAAVVVSIGRPKKRYGEAAIDKLAGLANAKPARFPHADFRDEVAEGRANALCPDHQIRFSRYAIYNAWQVTSSPPQDAPLAVCAANTVSPKDELPVTVVTRTRTDGDVTAPIVSYEANPAHRWYYYRDMTPDELLVFKGFDSDRARAGRVPHTAFSDPSCPAGTPTRSSVELRVLAFFE